MGYRLRRLSVVRSDPAKWSRFRWVASVWILASATLLIGGGFLLAGSHLLLAQGPWAGYAAVPGGLRIHGFLMVAGGGPLVLGNALPLFGYPEPRKVMKPALRFCAGYWLWMAIMLAFAPAIPNGSFSYVGFVLVLAVALWFALISFSSPPELVSKVETALYRAALDAGCAPRQAHQVVDNYLGGSRELG